MKALMTLVMSLNLILSPVVWAQAEVAKPKDEEINKMLGQKAGDVYRANPDGKDKSSYNKMILGMGIGIVGANLLVTCPRGPMYPSIMLFQAGGVIYILSELLGGKAHNDFLKKKTEDLEMVAEKMKSQGGGGEVQKEALETALKSEKETLKFINKRKTWFTALTVVFGAAAIAAAAEMIFPWPVPLGLIPAGCAPPIAIGSAKVTAAAVTAAYTFAAGGGTMGAGFAGALAALAIPVSGSLATAKNLAPGRIAVSGAATILVNGINSDLDKKAETAEKNIEKLEAALADFNANSTATNGIAMDTKKADDGTASNNDANLGAATTGGLGGGNKPSGGSLGTKITSNPSSGGSLSQLPTVVNTTNNKMCATQTSQGLDVSEKGCANPYKFVAGKFDTPVMNLPSMKNITQTISEISANLNSGNMEAADIAAAKLAAQAGRMEQLKKSIFEQTNKKLAANGKPQINMDSLVKDQINSLSSSLKKDNADAAATLASLNKSSVSLKDDLKGISDLKEKNEVVIDKSKETAAVSTQAPVIDPNTASDSGLEDIGADGLDGDELSAIDQQLLEQSAAGSSSPSGEISNEPDVSLFEQVSNRYIINYPTLVRRKSLETKTK